MFILIFERVSKPVQVMPCVFKFCVIEFLYLDLE